MKYKRYPWTSGRIHFYVYPWQYNSGWSSRPGFDSPEQTVSWNSVTIWTLSGPVVLWQCKWPGTSTMASYLLHLTGNSLGLSCYQVHPKWHERLLLLPCLRACLSLDYSSPRPWCGCCLLVHALVKCRLFRKTFSGYAILGGPADNSPLLLMLLFCILFHYAYQNVWNYYVYA